MTAFKKTMAEISQSYQNKNSVKTFRPENYLDIPRVLGSKFAIDMNRLVCTHQQHVASAYMRRIRKDKIQQRDVYFQKLQNIPMKIKRVDVGPDYTDAYTNLKRRFRKLGHDDKIQVARTPPYPHMEGSKYVAHASLVPNMNVLFKMNPVGINNTNNGNNNINNIASYNSTTTNNNHHVNGKPSPRQGRIEDELPFPLISPRRAKQHSKAEELSPRKRFAVDMNSVNTKVKAISSYSDDVTPRCPTNSPRGNAAFWSFNVPRELNQSKSKSHVSSIPRGKNALAAISSVQKHNKPLPAISSKA